MIRSKYYAEGLLSIAIKITADRNIVIAAIANSGTIARTIAPLPAFVFAMRKSRQILPSPANERNPAVKLSMIKSLASNLGYQSGSKNAAAKTGIHIASAVARIPGTDFGGLSVSSQLTMAPCFLGALFGLPGCDASIFTTSASFCHTGCHCAQVPCKYHNRARNRRWLVLERHRPMNLNRLAVQPRNRHDRCTYDDNT